MDALTPDCAATSFQASRREHRSESIAACSAATSKRPVRPFLDFTLAIQAQVWIGFRITFQYPYADVYPHFTNANLARSDGRSLGGGFGTATFRDQPAILGETNPLAYRATRLCGLFSSTNCQSVAPIGR